MDGGRFSVVICAELLTVCLVYESYIKLAVISIDKLLDACDLILTAMETDRVSPCSIIAMRSFITGCVSLHYFRGVSRCVMSPWICSI